MDASPPSPPEAAPRTVVDLGAIRRNVGRLREITCQDGADPLMMVVVKADGYGHGMEQVARAARAAGAGWLGVATGAEALRLRDSGDTGPLLCWLAVPGTDYAPLLAADVEVSAYSTAQLVEIEAAATEHLARVHLKVDTGLSRGGIPRARWGETFAAAAEAERRGRLRVTGLWSHLACSDDPGHLANDRQEQAFRDAVDLAAECGLRPRLRHLANSAAAVLRPSARFDMVRCGIAVYGLTPAPGVVSSGDLGLVPAMTVRGTVAMAKDIVAGDGVSYGHTFVAEEPMRVALVPLGYGDGVPRHASDTAEVLVGDQRGRILGRVCMDQVVVAAPGARDGDDFVLLGPGDHGEPTAQEWAEWCGTINYEIVTRMGGRQRREWLER